MRNWAKYIIAAVAAGAGIGGAYYYPAEFFITFTVGWVFIIPAAFAGFMIYGFWKYKKDMKTKITIQIKPTEAMRAMARREAAFQKERESMYEEMREGRIK